MPLNIGRKKRQRHQSFFSDQVIKDFSTACCSCELYFPEPSLTFDEFGVVKDVCLSGDSVTLRWSKHCMIHLCEIPDVSPEFPFTLEGTGQDCEICLNVSLKIGDFSYSILDTYWHEYKYKVGSKLRRFVLQFDDQDQKKFEHYEEKLKEILLEVNDIEEVKKSTLYLLVAVQTSVEKKKSSQSANRHSRVSLSELHQLEPTAAPTADPPAADPPNNSQNSSLEETSATQDCLVAPFYPAPFIPADPQRFYADLDDRVPSVNYNPELLQSITLLCDSLHIHPRELPHRLESILQSDTGSIESEETIVSPLKDRYKPYFQSALKTSERERSQTYPLDDYTERLNSELLPSEELYLPMGRTVAENQYITIKNNKEKTISMMEQAVMNPQLHKVQEMAQSLQTAINNSDEISAQEYGKLLAAQNVIVTIDVKLKQQSPAKKDNEFNLKVHVEDKESSGGIITVKVSAFDTIRDLKNRMLIKHMFPVEVQYWIIGKRIPQDNETLDKCRIKSHGYTAFLYLISAKAAGINKDEFMRRQNLLLGTEFTMGPTPQTPAPDMSQPPSRLGSSATPGSGATSSSSAGKPKMEPRVLEENLNILVKDEKRTPEKLQGHVQCKPPAQRVINPGTDNRVNQTGAEIRHVLEQIAPHIAAVGAKGPSLDTPLTPFTPFTPFGESRQRVPVMHPEENEEPQQGWSCPACTYINQPTRPGCELCASTRPTGYEIPADYVVTEEEKKRLEMEAVIERQTREAVDRERLIHQQEMKQNYEYMQETDALDIIPNMDQFTCPICFEDISSGAGVLLRECLHSFCKDCLRDAVQYNEEPVLKCPFMDDDYACDGILHDREVKALVSPAGFAKYLARSLATAESQAQNSFHCKTADCPGWCIYEDHVNFFVCQVCGKENCLTCKSIHQGMNCKQYQEDLKMRAGIDKAANQTQIMIKKMLDDGDAMNCPQCHVIVMKKEGCDWIQCSICKTEICWVRKMARWGPMGNGDISGGCKCRVNGQMCDPDCNNCH